jgi:hypothetical protein
MDIDDILKNFQTASDYQWGYVGSTSLIYTETGVATWTVSQGFNGNGIHGVVDLHWFDLVKPSVNPDPPLPDSKESHFFEDPPEVQCVLDWMERHQETLVRSWIEYIIRESNVGAIDVDAIRE